MHTILRKLNMNTLEAIFGKAKQLAIEKNLPYTGELMPVEAYQAIEQSDASVEIIDVRSTAELDLVGRVPNALHIQWAFYPGMVPNVEFADELQEAVKTDKTLIFMCRTGGRSHDAAVLAQQLGYSNVYNMAQGFEGEANANKQRTLINGWKHAGLPWTN